jgi:hypothetical protein
MRISSPNLPIISKKPLNQTEKIQINKPITFSQKDSPVISNGFGNHHSVKFNTTHKIKSLYFAATSKKETDLETPFSETILPIPFMMREILLWYQYLPKPEGDTEFQEKINALDFEQMKSDLETSHITQLYALMALKGSSLSIEKKNLIKKLLFNLKEERSSDEFVISAPEQLLIGCLMFTPLDDKNWKDLYAKISTVLMRGEPDEDDYNELFSSFIVPFGKGDLNALEPLLALHNRIEEQASDDTKVTISPISLWIKLNTHQPPYSETRLSKVCELIQKATRENGNFAHLQSEYELFLSLPVGEKKWNTLLKKILEASNNENPSPLYLMLDETLTSSKEENENWFKNLQVTYLSYDYDEQMEYYTGFLKIKNQLHSPTSDPKRSDDIEKIISSILQNPDNSLEREEFNHLNELLFSPIPYPIWKSIIAPVESGAKRGDISATLVPALTLAAQYILSTPTEKHSPEAVASARNFLDENNQDDQMSPVFMALLNIQSQTSAIPKSRQKVAETLLQELMAKNKENYHEKILDLYFTMPIDDAEWKAITEGVTELSGLGRTPDLIEVMVETSINDVPITPVPLPWLQQLKDVAKSENHTLAGLIGEQYSLMFGDMGLPEARKQKLVNGLNQIWESTHQFSPLFHETFKLITTAPVKTEQNWDDLLQSFVKEISLNKGKNPASLLIDQLENLDENDFTYPVWLSQLKELTLKEGTKDTTMLDLKIQFANAESASGATKEISNPVKSESANRSFKIKSLVSNWIKQKKKITDQEKQLLDLVQTLPTSKSSDWEMVLSKIEKSGLSSKQHNLNTAIQALQGAELTPIVINWLEKARLYGQSNGLNISTASALMETYNTLKNMTGPSESRKISLLKNFSNQSIQEGQGEKHNTAVLELLSKLPVSEEQFNHLLQLLPEKTSYEKVMPLFGSWFNHLALYGPFETDSASHESWKKSYERFLSLSSNQSLYREYARKADELKALTPVKPLLQANTAADLAANAQLVQSAIAIIDPKSSKKDSDYDDDDYGSPPSYSASTASYGGGYGSSYSSSKSKPSSYDDPSPKKPLPALTEKQKNAAQELFTKYPKMLFTMGLTVEELADMGIDKELLKDFYDPIYAPYGVDSMGKPLESSVFSASKTTSSSSASSSSSKSPAISPMPSTLGMLYVKAHQGDEQAFTELTLRLLNEPNALRIMQPLLQKIEREMDSYKSRNYKAKAHYPNEAEMMLLFKTKEAMSGEYATNTLSSSITSIDRFIDYNVGATHRITQIWGNLGLLAHAFRFWRFDTAGGPDSLFAKFGFKPSPARSNDNKYGKGYYISASTHPELGLDPGTVIEFRRGYLAVSSPSFGTLIVRNSSFVFGRDTLPHAAYFSPQTYSESELLNLDPANSSSFKKILDPNLYRDNKSIATKLEGLLNQIFKVKKEYGNWKFNPEEFTPTGEFIGDMTPGMKIMLNNLFNQFANAEMGLEKNPPALAFVHPQRPPTGEYTFEDENGIKQKHFVLDAKRIEELQDRLNGTWTPEKYPYSDWVSFIKTGVENKAELILVEDK